MEGKVKIKSTANCEVTVNLPDLRFRRTWAKKGAVIPVDMAVLEEAIFDPGFSNMINSGVLYIEDIAVKKALGLEPEDADEPQNIIVLNDSQMLRLLKVDPVDTFKKEIENLSNEQIENICDYAIDNDMLGLDPTKADLLKKRVGRDIIRSITLNREAKTE